MKEQNELLCLGLGMGFNIPETEQMEVIKSAGFDAFFYDRKKNGVKADTESVAEKAAKLGLIFQSVHAPFYGMDDIWHDESGEISKIMENDLVASIDDCHDFGVDKVIMHAIIGADNCTPTELGIKRLDKIIDHAVKRGVNIAFENTESEMYLEKIFENFGDVPNVGFCIDTGHEICYNYSNDLIGKYGKYLIATHLNDNMGMADPNVVTFYDDAHLLPFDGIADWQGIAQRLKKWGYNGILTFETIAPNRPERNANDIYKDLSFEEYVNKAYRHAVKFKELYKTI